MKYALVIPDGAADEPLESLGGRTVLQAANLPEMDRVAASGVLGRARNVPDRFLPGSDVATLSLLGYDPEVYFTGRAPLEAAAMGIKLGPDDWAVRCNLMTIEDGRMADFTAGHITDAEAADLIRAIAAEITTQSAGLTDCDIEFHPGVSYRNLLIVRGRPGATIFGPDTKTTPPHDVPGQLLAVYRPAGTGTELLERLMAPASKLIADHPVNKARVAAGKRPANAVWLWGQGNAPALRSFQELHGLRGAIISAVDLVRGVGMLAGFHRIDVPGATGYLDTDYAAKGRAAIAALNDFDFVCVHVEAPDEASHEGRADAKIEALERMDHDIVGPLHKALAAQGDYRLLITPDHSTLIRTKAHDRSPVPWAMCGRNLPASGLTYDESAAQSADCPFLTDGWRLMDRFIAHSQQA